MANLELKTNMKTLKLIAVVLAAGILLAAAYFAYAKFFMPIKVIDYEGQLLEFRADLREAAKVPVYPGESEVYRDTVHQLAKNITIMFKDAGDADNPMYIVEELEIINKMTIAYAYAFGAQNDIGEFVPSNIPTFDAKDVSEYANLPGKIQNPIIAIVHPKYANETAVRNYGHVTYISGRTNEELDLATVKFLMIVLGIDPSELNA